VTGVTLVNPSNATSTATVRLSGGSAGVTHMVARGRLLGVSGPLRARRRPPREG
jgi:hypothetical protein